MGLTKEVKIFVVLMMVAIAMMGVAIYLLVSPKSTVIRSPVVLMLKREMLVPSWSVFQGDPKAPFTLVEFGDYECPPCRDMEPKVAGILNAKAGKLNRVFHHCVRVTDHPNAKTLALAVQAAGEQGKLWQMHETIFNNQNAFDGATPARVTEELTKLARETGLDVDSFNKARESKSARDAVDRMEALAKAMKVSVTPTFCIVRPKGPMLFLSIRDMEYWLNDPEFWK